MSGVLAELWPVPMIWPSCLFTSTGIKRFIQTSSRIRCFRRTCSASGPGYTMAAVRVLLPLLLGWTMIYASFCWWILIRRWRILISSIFWKVLPNGLRMTYLNKPFHSQFAGAFKIKLWMSSSISLLFPGKITIIPPNERDAGNSPIYQEISSYLSSSCENKFRRPVFR